VKYLDYACAWAILFSAILFILVTEITHPRGAVLEVPILWILVAVFNFLRLRNGYANVRGLRISCIGANLMTLAIEIVRLKLFGSWVLRTWGPYSLITAIAVLAETIFSIIQKNDQNSETRL
jgi:hypothetical protein